MRTSVSFGCAVLLTALWGCSGGDNDDGVNLAPRIIGLDDVTVNANETSMALDFTVDDDQGPARVGLSATSADPDLLADASVVFGGEGGERSVTVTPVPGRTGSVVVTVTASDPRGVPTTADFEVTVVAQALGFADFFRDSFADDVNGSPRELNSRTFDQDAADDEFVDLLAGP